MSTKQEKVTISWSPTEYFSISEIKRAKVGEKISSPSFSSQLHEDIRWGLELYPNGYSNVSKDHVALYCQTLLDDQNKLISENYSVKTSISFSIKNILSGKIYHYDMNFFCHVFSKCYRTAGTKFFIEQRHFHPLLNTYYFKIVCEINAELIVNVLTHSVTDSSIMKNLYQNLEKLMKNHDFSDVTLVVSGKQIPAHKAILSARSSVFDALFKSDMIESTENIVNIKNFQFDTAMEMLRFIYTGRAKNLDKLAYEILSLADQYDLEELKKKCEYVLCKNITTENTTSMLILADRHSTDNLKKATLNFLNGRTNVISESQTISKSERSEIPTIFKLIHFMIF